MKMLTSIAAALALAAAPAAAQDADAQTSPEELADRFETALLAGDYRDLPITEDFVYFENGAQLDPWDGMWRTLTAVAGIRFHPDLDLRLNLPQGDSVIRVVETLENGVQGVMAYALQARDGQIARIDVLPIREEFGGDRGGTLTLLQPMLTATMDGELVERPGSELGSVVDADPTVMLAAVRDYLGLTGDEEPRQVRFADDCFRIDNGHRVTGVGDAAILDPAHPDFRPFALGCEEQFSSGYYSNFVSGRSHAAGNSRHGIVMAFVRLDQPGTVLSFTTPEGVEISYPGPRGAVENADTGEQFDGRILTNMITPMSINGMFIFKFDESSAIQQVHAFYRGAPLGWDAVPD